jgi:tRNA-dihydrouridine synthase
MGQPWIAEDVLRALSDLPPLDRTVAHLKEALLEHFSLIVRYQPERQALLDMRRVGCWYLKRCDGAKTLRMQINRSASTSESFQLIEQFPWDTISFIQEPIFAESES